jgi:hypothetical protein
MRNPAVLGIKEADNLINHFVIVGDMSPSMNHHKEAFVKAFDHFVSKLAMRSKELDQETRITVYLFSSTSVCAFYDMDVLRMPSIRELYDPNRGYRTALLDATARALDDLKMTPQKYGQHAFVLWAFTDGIENDSHLVSRPAFRDKITSLPDNWTVATLTPDMDAVKRSQELGFPSGNIDTWDTRSSTGTTEALSAISRATDNFMKARDTARRTGTRFTRTTSIFSMDPSVLNTPNLFKAGMRPLTPADDYREYDVVFKEAIKVFVERCHGPYHLGIAYYQLGDQAVVIQPQKKILIRKKSTGEVFAGDHARELLNLPSAPVKVKAGYNPDYDVFVQSTSVNRNLLPGTKVLVVPG